MSVTESHTHQGELADSLAQIRTSAGLVVDFSKGKNKLSGQTPYYDQNTLKNLYLLDPIISTAVDFKAEMVLSNGWRFRGKNERNIEKAEKEFERLDMLEVLLNFIKQSEVFGDAYLEPKFTASGKLQEVYPLESAITRMVYDEHGKVTEYLQVNWNTNTPTDPLPRWQPEEILHYKMSWFGSNVYSYAPVAAMAEQIVIRNLGNSYLKQVFKNLPPKMIYYIYGANKDQLKQVKQSLYGLKSNFNQDLVLRVPQGVNKAAAEQFVVDFTKGGIMEVLKYAREEVLTRMRVPPTIFGLTQDSKSRPEPQLFGLEIHLRMNQRRLAKFLNDKFMPLLGLTGVEIFFPPVSITTAEKLLSIARAMVDAGLINEADEKNPAIVFLKEQGFTIPKGTKVKEEETKKDIDLMPSRKRLGMKEGKEQKSNKDEKAVSNESKGKLEKAQVRTPQTAIEKGDFASYLKNKQINRT